MESDNIIPHQETGAASTTEEIITLPNVDEAKSFYGLVKQRLLNIGQWKQYAGAASADFALCDQEGAPVDREPRKGDHFQIDIPGPGPVAGDGFDWVRIEAMEEVTTPELDQLIIRVRPATSPRNKKPGVAHFFSDEATSNFLVRRKDTTVTAAVLGRNEKPNTEADAVTDKARNAVIATGAVSAFSKLQWKNLVRGFIHSE